MSTAKKGRLALLLMSLGCVVAIGVCLIVDFAVNGEMVWSWYPLISVLFAWVVFAPLTVGVKLGRWLSLAAASLAVLPFLYFLERLTPAKGWFEGIAVPCAVMTIIATWLMVLLARFSKISKWFLAAISVFIYGVVVATAVRVFVSNYLGESIFSLDNFINFFACTAAAIILVIIGINRQSKD